jgi:transcriptional regulator of acetoin/glycerol metabolism
MKITASSLAYEPDRIWRARHAYFEEGRLPQDDLIDQPLLRSWQRCGAYGRSVAEHVAFDPVERGTLARLHDEHRDLLTTAHDELDDLAGAVGDAGYAVMLTDARGHVLGVAGPMDRHSAPLRQAFRPGVDVSEAAIGTSAMSLALAERQAVRVLGPEHFFTDNQIFHCCAAPVFDPRGRLLGSVDATRDMPGLVAGALALTQRCARRIERQLFDGQPAFVRITLESQGGLDDACLAFDRDGQWVAANSAACRLIDVPLVPDGVRFDELFEERFDAFVSGLRRSGELRLRLKGGVRLLVRSLAGAAAAKTSVALAARDAHSRSAPPVPADPAFGATFTRALRAFDAGLPVLVTGETGAGKEVAAQALHRASRRHGGPLVAINCGAVAAELFGHVEGAYTGARRGGSPGKIAAAHGGTLLLDEIGEMPLDVQVALLRVLDEQAITPVGATRATPVDVRFVCATHRDLCSLVAAGHFREDLFYRVSGFVLTVPPLRERADFDAVLDGLCAKLGCDPARLPSALRRALQALPWPGNVRQLRHALTLALATAPDDDPLDLDHFTSVHAPMLSGATSVATLKELQRRAIDAALAQTQGHVPSAAKLLGMGRATLYRKLAEQD